MALEATAVPPDVDPSAITAAGLPGVLTTQRGFVAVPTEDVRAFVSQQAMLIGIGFVIGIGVGLIMRGRRPAEVLSGRGGLGALSRDSSKRIRLFQLAMDDGDCRAGEGLIEDMGEEDAVRALRSMILQYHQTCRG
jgi:hypothetical protein